MIADKYDEDITPVINTRMFDITSRAVVVAHHCHVFKYRNICPALENINSQEDCPICYESKKLGKLPKCSHSICIICWKDWWKTGNHTCPICRQTQN